MKKLNSKYLKCPFCNKYTAVRQGHKNNKQRGWCKLCNKWFTKQPRKSSYLKQKYINMFLDHLNGISYRNLTNRYGYKKTHLCKIVSSITDSLKSCIDITKQLVDISNYSGNLIVDGKYVPVKDCIPNSFVPKPRKRTKIERGLVFITNIDYHTHDFIHLCSDLSENSWILNKNFKSLKAINYPIKSLTCDKKKKLLLIV